MSDDDDDVVLPANRNGNKESEISCQKLDDNRNNNSNKMNFNKWVIFVDLDVGICLTIRI